MVNVRIDAIAEIVQSERDRAGNVYTFMVYTRTKDGITCAGTISGGEGNVTAAMRHMHGDNYYYCCRTIPKRAFHSWTKNLPYAGCTVEEIAMFVETELEKRERELCANAK